MARWLASLAILGKYSLIWMPGTSVSIGWNGPPWGCPGLRSKVSIWLGPPLIHSRMQERLRCGLPAVASASAPSQPDVQVPSTPAAASRSQSRRERRLARADECERIIGESPGTPESVVENELGTVEQHPKHVRECLRRVAGRAAGLHVLDEPLALIGAR